MAKKFRKTVRKLSRGLPLRRVSTSIPVRASRPMCGNRRGSGTQSVVKAILDLTLWRPCCHMGTAIKHPACQTVSPW